MTGGPAPSIVSLPPPSGAELERLADKYAQMASLRRAKRRGEADAPREVYRTLASEYPGSLNELDTLTLRELDERAGALRAAALHGAREPWMDWLDAYHRLMRAALLVKATLRGKRPDAATSTSLVRSVSRSTGVEVDPSFVELVARPPGGRLVATVFDCLGRHFGAPSDEMWTTLFPRRRARRTDGVALVDEVPEDGPAV